MAATIETISVKLVKEVVNEISTRVSESNEEMRATEKEVAASVRVLSFRSFVGKTWSYIYKMFGKEKKILANEQFVDDYYRYRSADHYLRNREFYENEDNYALHPSF